LISLLTFFLTPKDSYPPIYALILSLYATAFTAYWRVRERKFAIQWGTRGCESVAVGRLRPEYVANLNFKQSGGDGDGVDAVHAGDEGKRDVKVAASIPVIAACGMGLGGLLMGIFVLEAFVGEVYDGFGKEVVVSPPLACSPRIQEKMS
jgi:anoctamin-10